MHKTTVGKEGLVIPEGLVVLADNWTIQRNKEYWGEDADEFRPDRYTPNYSIYNNLNLDSMK